MAAAAKSTSKKAPSKKTAPAPVMAAPEPVAVPSAADPMYPIVDRTPWGIIALILGIIGLGGVGTIIAGCVNKRHMGRDIAFGIVQIIVPILGWLWGLVWGILIFVKGNK
jgi:hypothetical protein